MRPCYSWQAIQALNLGSAAPVVPLPACPPVQVWFWVLAASLGGAVLLARSK